MARMLEGILCIFVARDNCSVSKNSWYKEADPRSEATDPTVSRGQSRSPELGSYCRMEVMAHH